MIYSSMYKYVGLLLHCEADYKGFNKENKRKSRAVANS